MDALLSLSFSIQSNKGVYALLLGSGVSRAARIPTGWEIVLELVRKLAHLSDEECEPDPEKWYQNKFGKSPDYAELLEMVASTPSERQQVLRSYFEPTEAEQEEGAKQPTKAHHAIAQLAADGYIKVIITTNFDRLMERALEAAGVAPSVVSTADQIEGALPLVHQRCCVIKVHGDYLDTRLKNTPIELGEYDSRLNSLLERIFDDFGLVTCGWSADWDVALRAAIERAPNRRFSTYWAARGAPSETAIRLIEHRAGKTISISDADSFFVALQEKVQALAQFGEPHPLSVHAATATTKRYLAEARYRIQLSDLINNEAERAANLLYTGDLGDVNASADSTTLTTRVRQYDSVCTNLVAMASLCGQWGDQSVAPFVQSVLKRFYGRTASSGSMLFLAFQKYPIPLVAYAALIGAVSTNNLKFIGELLSGQLLKEHARGPLTAVDVICPFSAFDDTQRIGWYLEGMNKRYAPINDWLHDTLNKQVGKSFSTQMEFTRCFDTVEILLALAWRKSCEPMSNPNWHPLGAYGYRRENRAEIVEAIGSSIESQAAASPFVQSKIFGDTPEECATRLRAFSAFAEELSIRWH